MLGRDQWMELVRADGKDRLVEFIQSNKLVMDYSFPATALFMTHEHRDMAVQAEDVHDRDP